MKKNLRRPSPFKTSAAVVLTCVIVLTSIPSAFAESPDAATVIGKMKEAMEPSRTSIRDIEITSTGPGGDRVTWKAKQARGISNGVPTVLTVLTSPDDIRGNAVLVREDHSGGDQEWVYFPVIRRVRKLVYGHAGQSFLGTDLSHQDLGFVSPRDRYYELLRTEQYRDKKAYVVREVPADSSMYSRVDMWIDTETYLPMKREYYDRAGLIWKVAEYDDGVVIDTLPTVLRFRIVDKQQGGGTELKADNVRYGVSIPSGLLTPDALPGAVDSPIWQQQ